MDSTAYGTEYQDLFALLAAPFTDAEVKQRSQGGRQLDYISARTAANRFDEVVGPANWKAKYRETEKGVVCTISVRLPSGEWIDKEDAGGYAGMQDPGDDEKSGYSDAFKRASVVWGVGRFLYGDGVPAFARSMFPNGQGEPRRKGGGGASYSPQPAQQPREQRSSSPPPSNGNGGSQRQYDDTQAPRDGRGLFAWAMKKAEEMGGDKWVMVNTIQKLSESNGWGFPQRLGDWTGDQVAEAWPFIVGSANAPQPQQQPRRQAPPARQPQPAATHTPRPGDVPDGPEDDEIPF